MGKTKCASYQDDETGIQGAPQRVEPRPRYH